jgi:hypothetical protein
MAGKITLAEMPEIEKNVPIPKAKDTKVEFMKTMEPGDRIKIKTIDRPKWMSAAAKVDGYDFAYRTLNIHETGIWRLS